MAMKQRLKTAAGVQVDYHRIADIRLTRNQLLVDVASYRSAKARADGFAPVETRRRIGYPLNDEQRARLLAVAYEIVSESEEWEGAESDDSGNRALCEGVTGTEEKEMGQRAAGVSGDQANGATDTGA